MEPTYEEYLANHGTIVKPYYWLSFSLDCSNCPYHIRTGEEARVSLTEFCQIFGFPYGTTYPQTKHLTFYELKTSSGSLVQKGHASSCTGNYIHPESMLFEMNGYLDSAIYNNDSIRHIILYCNNSPCNEANHCCISKVYNFLITYPGITLSIYFSQLYHTETDFPASAWNREALRSLASLWPRVVLSPISGGIWHSVLHSFVSGVSGSHVFQPILTGRTKRNPNTKAQVALESYPLNNAFPGQSFQMTSGIPPDLRAPVVFVLLPLRDLPPMHMGQDPNKPRNIIRHLNMPQMSFQETEDLERLPTRRSVETVEITEWFASSKQADEKTKKKKGKK
uniref:Apolipoprotein B mRNA editing enzyme catalytic polypeptide like 4 n=1 Tax=Theropithecus gelada TaxID=9565 RepID=A0A8D2G6I9_THEGE